MLRWVWACLLNDATCNSGHHLASADSSRWRWLFMTHTTQERHVVSVAIIAGYGTAASYNVTGWGVDDRVLLLVIADRDAVLVLILAGELLGALTVVVQGARLPSWLWRVLDKLCHADPLLWALTVDDTRIHVRLPVIGWLLLLDRWLRLPSLLFLLKYFVAPATVRFRTEPVVVS